LRRKAVINATNVARNLDKGAYVEYSWKRDGNDFGVDIECGSSVDIQKAMLIYTKIMIPLLLFC